MVSRLGAAGVLVVRIATQTRDELKRCELSEGGKNTHQTRIRAAVLRLLVQNKTSN